jgi:hypothetical protein
MGIKNQFFLLVPENHLIIIIIILKRNLDFEGFLLQNLSKAFKAGQGPIVKFVIAFCIISELNGDQIPSREYPSWCKRPF